MINGSDSHMKHHVNNRSEVPKAAILRARLQSLAMMDAILMPDWEMRYFSFNSNWTGKMMGSMRDGEGSEFFFLFDDMGAAGKIYCPEHCVPDVVLAQISRDFSSFLSEPAFSMHQVTCCLWQRFQENDWSVVPQEIEKIPLLAFVGDQGDYYRTWAERYYERGLLSSDVETVFEHRPLTRDLLFSLSKEPDFQRISSEAAEIAYPIAY